MDQDALVRLTLPGYNNVSISLSDKLPDIVDPVPLVGRELASDAPGSCVIVAWTVVAIAAYSSGIVFAGAGNSEASCHSSSWSGSMAPITLGNSEWAWVPKARIQHFREMSS